MSTPQERVEAAATALARQWAQTPHDVAALSKVLHHDAWILERAGLLAKPRRQGQQVTSTRITVDVTFDPDAVTIHVADDGGLNTLELATVLDIARASILNPDNGSIPT